MKINDEILYFLGALRDGSIDIRKGKNYEIKIGQKCAEWLEMLKKIIDKNFLTNSRINNGLVRITNKEIVLSIKELSDIKNPQENWNTPSILKNLSSKEVIPYIRGFWDAEGGLPENPELTTKAEQRYVSFHQKNKESLEFIRNHLIRLGFHPTNMTFCGKVSEFRVCRKAEIKNFYNLIGSWHKEKSERLKGLVSLP